MARPANPELRAEILTAATRIVEQCGPDCVTMREVAEEVGYTPTTLYLYFKDKDAILRQIVVDGFAEMAEFVASAAVGPTALDKLRQRARGYIVWGLMRPGLYQLMFESRLEAEFTPEDGDLMSRVAADGDAVIAEALAGGQFEGLTDPVALGNCLWAATHGTTSLAISRRLVRGADPMSARDLLDAATAVGDQLVNSLIAVHSA
jgi:AcrR family transcriptional regulator